MRIYESVTRAIIDEMERGAVPWVRPWKTDRHNAGSVMPGNAITGRSYSGINVPILWASADSNGYPSHAWMTFKQAQDHGAHVRKGERGTHVVFTKPIVFKGEDDEIEKRSMLREYTVFNVAQIEDFEIKRAGTQTRTGASCGSRSVHRRDQGRHPLRRQCSLLRPVEGFHQHAAGQRLHGDRAILRHRTSRTWSLFGR